MSKMKKHRLLRGIGKTVVVGGAVLLTLGLAAGSMLENNSAQVNNFLGTVTTKTTGGGDYDSFVPDEEYLNEDGTANTDALVQSHIDLGTRIQDEGSVLLKNENNALPLSSGNNITLLGLRSYADDTYYGMSIGSPVTASQNVSLYDAFKSAGFNINDTLYNAYESYTGSSSEVSINDIISTAGGESTVNSSIQNYNDAAIIVIGRSTEENNDKSYTTSGNGDLVLTNNETSLINWATSAGFSKVIVLVNCTNTMEIESIKQNDGVDAILWIGMPGNYGSYGIANILKGDANPSGKLTDTYAVDSGGAPGNVNFGDYTYSNASTYVDDLDEANKYVVQNEGIYTGYRYYETRYEDAVLEQGNATSTAGVSGYNSGNWTYEDEVSYSFGYGLSYTTFDQSIDDVEFSDDGRTATVTVTVENTGDVAGKDVVQVYAQSPYTDYDKEYNVEKASVQLLGYEKTDIIEPNESETIDVELDLQYLASYDSEEKGTYIMESGDDAKYYFVLGTNDEESGAHAAINNILAKKGYSSETNSNMVGDGDASLAYEFEWNYDEDLFSTSKDGTEITNELDDLDYNYYNPGTITYLSRSDWQGTYPQEYRSLEITSSMQSILKNNFHTTTDTDVTDLEFGQEGTYYFPDLFGADFDDERWDDVINQVTLESAVFFTSTGNRTFYEISEIKFLSANSYTENGTVGISKSLTSQSDEYAPWCVSSDDPNASFRTNTFPVEVVQASTWNKDLIEEMGVLWGNDALFINIPMIWAPGTNLHRSPYNGRNGEYYSEDPIISGYSTLAVAKGALSKGLITAMKHYALNQQETNRLGVSTFTNEQAARELELRAYQIAVEGETDEEGNNVGILGIMTGYNRVGATYSGSHTGMMKEILRNEWGYKGYVTSDLIGNDCTYMPYEESMLANTTNYDLTHSGTTIWLDDDYSTKRTVSSICDDIKDDADVLRAIKENLHYSLYAFSKSNLANWMTSSSETIWAWNWWRGTYVGIEIFGGVAIAVGVALYVIGVVLTKPKPVADTSTNSSEEEKK